MGPRSVAWWFVAALALALSALATATLSGLYADNGFGQTEIQRLMSPRERREVEQEILSILGLSRRPRKRPLRASDVAESASSAAALAGPAPRFLLDVYETLQDAPAARRPHGDFNLSRDDLNVIDKSDVIMGFVSHKEHSWSHSLRHEHGRRLWFDVLDAPSGDALLGAELRLYQAKGPPPDPSRGHDPDQHFDVSLYQLTPASDEGEELRLVDAVRTSAGAEGWLLFNATRPLSEWLASPSANLGLYLTVRRGDGRGHDLHPDEIGIVSDKEEEEKEPFMVAFFKSSGIRETRVRTTRDTSSRKRRKSNTTPADMNPLQASSHQWPSRSCQMLELYVNFKDLRWEDWIIAPAGFQAYYCSGECNFPLNAHMNATNHAIVQTLVHLMNPLQVPKPCCAPTKLGPIQILYYVEDSHVTLQRYKNMVVKSCGCH